MKSFYSNNLFLVQSQSLIERASASETAWDFAEVANILKPIWDNFDLDPVLQNYTQIEQAHLSRICGNFLLRIGRAENQPNYIERGKNLLTRAVRVFEDLDDIYQAIEAEVLLAYSYFLEGKTDEFRIFLDNAELKFHGNQLHPTYLLIQVYRLIYYNQGNEFTKSLELINNLKTPIDNCQSEQIKAQFYIEAGIFYRHRKKYSISIEYYELAFASAESINNRRIKGIILNNLSFLYKERKEFDQALQKSNQSLEIYRELNDLGWIPHGLDTNAQIYFDKRDYQAALSFINDAICLFYQGTDYIGLLDSLWFKTKILFALKRDDHAKQNFAELRQNALEKLGEFTFKRYEKKLFTEFKNKFGNQPKDKGQITPLEVIPPEKLNISDLKVQNLSNVRFYKFSRQKTVDYLFGLNEETIIAVESESRLKIGDLLIFKTRSENTEIGELFYEEDKAKWIIENTKKPIFHSFQNVDHIGKIIGFCPAANFSQSNLVFSPIEIMAVSKKFSA